MDFKNYKFRAHSIGRIMLGLPKPLTANQQKTYEDFLDRFNGNGKPLTLNQTETFGGLLAKKNAKCSLTDGAKKYLTKLVFEELTGRSKKLNQKYLDKGIRAEEKSLSLYSNHKEALVLKNKDRKTNDFFTGEADIARYKIRDIKSSWEYDTFPLTDLEISNPLYKWQLDTYMDLWNLKRAELIYCLVDTPPDLVNDELRRLDWKFNLTTPEGDYREESIELVVETISNLIYTFKGLEAFCEQSTTVKIDWFIDNFKEIPEEIRIKIFKHNYCETRNSQLKEMVKLAREYMNSILEDIGENIINLTEYKTLKSA